MATASHVGDISELLQGDRVHFNLFPSALVEYAIRRQEAQFSARGALVGYTNFTGRLPKDKFIVRDSVADAKVAWGAVNQPFDADKFDALYDRVMEHLQDRELFVQDLFCGADPTYRLPVRVINEHAWHNLFVRQLFLRPSVEELKLHHAGIYGVCAPSSG